MLDRLIKWLATVLVVVVVGTAIGGIIDIAIATIPLWVLVVVVMAAAIAVFKFVVWAITLEGW